MKPYSALTPDALQAERNAVLAQYQALQKRHLHLDMSRGKPGKAQLDLVSDLLQYPSPADFCRDGFDARNYGELYGLPSARKLFAELLGVKPEEVLVGGNASLSLMYSVISKAYTHGLLHSPRPWCKEAKIKFLCPAPGYDRHFKISQSFGMEMIPIPMTPTGPDMAQVEALVQDPTVKGMWCVPKYSNPQGIVYSEETIQRIAHLHPAAPDFTLMWDNAYCVHEFAADFAPFPDILTLCREAGNPDMVFEFASTSKITFPGAGVACMAASADALARVARLMAVEIISFDKVNQLRHVCYLRDRDHILELMKRHAAILAPKFHTVLDTLEREIAPLGIAHWEKPVGGYFISLDAMPGTAKRVWQLCQEAGVVLTNAGATFPCGIDPQDSNLRIAPSLPPVEELRQAVEVLCTCLKLAALEKRMSP